MSSNKYLEKVAGWLDKSIGFVDDVIGHSAGKLKQEAEILSRAHAMGRTPRMVNQEASAANQRMVKARIQTGLGIAGTTTAGFLGLHKYHQHRDAAIMDKINSMYVDKNN